jgi:predicted aspartyl protease
MPLGQAAWAKCIARGKAVDKRPDIWAFYSEAFDMGTFHTRCRIANPSRRTKSATVPKILVDTGSEYTWVPAKLLERLAIGHKKKDVRFVMANGEQITRRVGFAIVRVDGAFTIDEVVFGEPGDLTLLGARTLEGLNLRLDTQRKKLVAAGPVPAAA